MSNVRTVIQQVTLRDVLEQRPPMYDQVVFALDAARKDEQVNQSGDFLYVLEAASTLSASIKFNNTYGDGVPLKKGRKFQIPFAKFFLTNAAAAGSTLTLLIGKDLSFEFEELGIFDIYQIQQPVKIQGSTTAYFAVVTITATATVVAYADTTRRSITIYNEGPNSCRLGDSSVTWSSLGILLPVGASLTLENTIALYAICNTGLTTQLSVVKEHN